MNLKLKEEIRRMIQPKAQFECERCGKHIKRAGLYEHRHQQYVTDNAPEIKRYCRNCIYTESFGSKRITIRKRNNQIENESHLYANID